MQRESIRKNPMFESFVFDDAPYNRIVSDSGQSQISLWNISAFSVREVMRIDDRNTQHEFR